jgi:putative ribosome biogenesis GTPase RsgA
MNNLFVGRRDSISQLRKVISDKPEKVKIISIWGKSGVGKSSLLNEV